MPTNEEIYDAEIAPALAELCKKCNELGMSFVARVEYEPGEAGTTIQLTEDATIAQKLARYASLCNGNYDQLSFSLLRDSGPGNSMFLHRFQDQS